MPIQKIPLETLQKIRQHLQTALMLPGSEDAPRSSSSFDLDSEPPEPDSLGDLGSLFDFGSPAEFETHAPNLQGRWFISSTNPGAALLKLPGVKLRSGVRLVSYLHRTAEAGVGATWAVPESLSTTAQLEKVLNGDTNSQTPPQPEAAFTDVMDAIEGDRSPLSFMITSLFHRELREFGAAGKSCNWSHHRLIGAIPAQVKWQWRVKAPQDLSPKIMVYDDQRVAIEFFTCRVTAPVALFQHVDQYPATSYKPTSADRPIAIPGRA